MQHVKNINREMDTLRKNQKARLKTEKTGTAMKTAFRRVHTAEGKAVSLTRSQRFPNRNADRKKLNVQGLWGNFRKYNTKSTAIPEEERKKKKDVR